SDAIPDATPVMMVAEDYWRARMGADPSVIGSTLTVSDVQRTVIGVWPRSARFRIEEPDFFTPLPRGAEIDRRFFSIVMALLEEGVTQQDAEAEMAALSATIEDDPDRPPDATEAPVILPVNSFLADIFVQALWILFAGVGLLAVVAGFNAASLLLNRAVDREHELGVRVALGGGAGRLVRHFVLEGGLLAGLGALLGVGGARLATGALSRLAPADIPDAAFAGGGGHTVSYALGLVITLTVICGLVPAIHLRSPAVRSLVARGQRTAGGWRQRLRNSLVAAQVGLAVVLLIGAGLTVRSLQRINALDFGFDPDGLTIVTVRLPLQRYEDKERRAALAGQVREALAALPGVGGVSVSGVLPLSYGINRDQLYLAGEEPPVASDTGYSQTASSSAGFLAVTGIPLLEGRDFTEDERRAGGDRRVVLVNQGFAARYPGSVVGRTLLFADDPEGRRIVGVVGDVRTNDIRDGTVRAQVYYPDDGVSSGRSQRFLVRTSDDPAAFLAEVGNRVRSVDPELLVSSVETGPTMVARQSADSRFLATLLAIFAAVSLSMSIAGVYGVMTLSVSRRTREIGIRMALGAWPSRVVRTVVSDMLRPALLGLIAGLALAGLGAHYLADVLYEVSPRDPVSFIAATLILGTAALLAAHLPARRATRVDPTEALRRE
ncbi:MAG: ABC transporter permease, partial [Acidobacteriota bacterium]